MQTASILEIKRFAVHDGDGIRTTVFFKGCPLHCTWCHNPEGLSFRPQISYNETKCIGCGECLHVCESGAHGIEAGSHIFHRDRCIACGECEKVCLGNAIKYYGKEVTVRELLPILLADREFFENSGGGVTLSGGECLCQAEFCAELLKALKENGIHTAVDTCGFVSREAIDLVMPYTNIFLFDIKAADNEVHRKYTGQSNVRILDNLHYIDDSGKDLEIRIPYVPECNAGEMEGIKHILADLKNVRRIRVLPYHNYAGSKYSSLGMTNNLPCILPKSEEIAGIEQELRKYENKRSRI